MAGQIFVICAIVAACALLTSLLIVLLQPTFARHFMAEPNERSAHVAAVPQGAGLAIVTAMIAIYVALWAMGHLKMSEPWPVPVLGAAVGLTILGALDDAVSVPISWRLAGQLAAALAIVLSLPPSFQILPGILPMGVERTILVIGTVGFVNAVNFLDGIDWITVVQTVPITIAVIAMRVLGVLPENVALLAMVLLGGVLGFAFFNKHPAQIFLGDAGSLPIGLCLAWMLFFVAKVDIAAALLLPMYTLSDSGLTLARRLIKGEKVFAAHKTHFYQRAITLGFKAPDVTARIFLLGSFLAALAVGCVLARSPVVDFLLVVSGAGATSWMLSVLAQGRQ